MAKQKVVIVGGGAAGIMCACHLDPNLFEVTLIEKTSRIGRKLLVAGEGGFNLTFHESIEDMSKKYYPKEFLQDVLSHFSNKDLRDYLLEIGIETYVGSSNRVFPTKGIKPYQVVAALEERLKNLDVEILINTEWKGWDSENILIANEEGLVPMEHDILILALGGSSWSKTGSNGNWKDCLEKEGIQVNDFYPSNCAWKIQWPESLIQVIEGKPLKNITLSVGEELVKGEALITNFGIEGNAIYALSKPIRDQILSNGIANLQVDLKPGMSIDKIINLLTNRNKSLKHCLLHQIKISNVGFELVKHLIDKDSYQNPEKLAKAVKSLTLITDTPDHIDKAISTSGGVCLSSITKDFELKVKPSTFVIGEMLDWDTRTGGYLLQACFSMGVFMAHSLRHK